MGHIRSYLRQFQSCLGQIQPCLGLIQSYLGKIIFRTNSVIFRTNPEKSRESPKTVQRQSRNNQETVQRQSCDSPETSIIRYQSASSKARVTSEMLLQWRPNNQATLVPHKILFIGTFWMELENIEFGQKKRKDQSCLKKKQREGYLSLTEPHIAQLSALAEGLLLLILFGFFSYIFCFSSNPCILRRKTKKEI